MFNTHFAYHQNTQASEPICCILIAVPQVHIVHKESRSTMVMSCVGNVDATSFLSARASYSVGDCICNEAHRHPGLITPTVVVLCV